MDIIYESLDFTDQTLPFIFHRGCEGDFLPHWHDSIEIHSIYQGTEHIMIDSHQFPVEPADVVFIASSKIHWYTNAFHHKYHTLIVHPRFLINCGIDPTTPLTPCFKDPFVTQLFREIAKDEQTQPPYHQTLKKAKIMMLLVHLYRHHKSENYSATDPKILNENVTKILKYIKENYSENITINDIGKAVGLSPSYLCACFRNATKTSINKYLNNIRCNEAKRLLTEENISVTEVAMQCGFNNMSYFSRMYRNIIGELPSQTLKRVNNNHPPA